MNSRHPRTRSGRALPALLFVASQVLILGGAGGAVAWRMSDSPPTPQIPELRATPLEIGPVYDYDVVISDEQLSYVLTRLRPKLDGPKTKINQVDHALRFWGSQAMFADPAHPSGAEMRQLLINHERFKRLYGEGADERPLLINQPHGVRVRVQEGERSSSHYDHTVASLAEVGTPLDFPIQTPNGSMTYRAMVEQVYRDFSINQVEYEWSTMVFAMFSPSPTPWRTKEGQAITFDALADRLMRQEQPQGVCFGNHRLYSLVVLLRVDQESPILSPEAKSRIVSYLQGMTQRLVATQHVDGFWNGDWPTKKPAEGAASQVEGDRLGDRIIATGHALEWWAMVPEELADEIHPPRHVLVAAGKWLVKTVEGLTDEQIDTQYTFLSHAGRALALWRGKYAYEVPLNETPRQPAESPDKKES